MTVQRYREQLSHCESSPQPERRIGADGKARPTKYKTQPEPEPEEELPSEDYEDEDEPEPEPKRVEEWPLLSPGMRLGCPTINKRLSGKVKGYPR